MILMKRKLAQALLDDPNIYSNIRLSKELATNDFDEIESSLEFEIRIYKEVPELLYRNYETSDHFLAYISVVKKYRETIDKK